MFDNVVSGAQYQVIYMLQRERCVVMVFWFVRGEKMCRVGDHVCN